MLYSALFSPFRRIVVGVRHDNGHMQTDELDNNSDGKKKKQHASKFLKRAVLGLLIVLMVIVAPESAIVDMVVDNSSLAEW